MDLAAPNDRAFRWMVLIWALVGVAVWYLSDQVGRAGQMVLAGLWIVGWCILLRHFLVSLFGPVLSYELLRAGRKRYTPWFRVAYAIFLSGIFSWLFLTWYELVDRQNGRASPKSLSQLAETFFYVYMVIQFIMVCLLTPASVAGAISDEKERRTLEFLLATDLRDREIVFGKLAARVLNLILFLAAGMPILGLVQFFGGIDPDHVIAAFFSTFLLVLSLSALGIATSVLSRKVRDAIALAYLTAVAYVIGSLCINLMASYPGIFETYDIFGYQVTTTDLVYPAMTGNPFFMVSLVLDSRNLAVTSLFKVVSHFAIFHLTLIFLLLLWSGLRLRSIALRQTFGSVARPWFKRRPKIVDDSRSRDEAPPKVAKKFWRPEIGESPIIWKEVFTDTGLRFGILGRLVVYLIVVLSFAPAVLIAYQTLFINYGPRRNRGWWQVERWEDFSQAMNGYSRGVGAFVAFLLFLAIAIRGAGSILGERDRHSLDVLLTTPLSAAKILWGKWWGCLLGMRNGWMWLFAIWMLGLGAGSIHPIMLIPLFISTAIYAAGFAWLGLFCSLYCRTTLRATMAAVMGSIFFSGGYFLVFAMCCLLPMSFGSSARDKNLDILVDLFCGPSPIVNLAWLPLPDFKERYGQLASRDVYYPVVWVFGLIFWLVFSWLLSVKCQEKFSRMANRLPIDAESRARAHRERANRDRGETS